MKVLEICWHWYWMLALKLHAILCLNNAKLLGIFFSHLICKNFKISNFLMSKWTNEKQINIVQENIGMGKVLHVHIELFISIHDN
jgi:hypothetical protein